MKRWTLTVSVKLCRDHSRMYERDVVHKLNNGRVAYYPSEFRLLYCSITHVSCSQCRYSTTVTKTRKKVTG